MCLNIGIHDNPSRAGFRDAKVTHTPMADLHKTPLNARHIELGAKMVPFAGWEMPLHYGSILAEHEMIRKRAGIFDLCHMTRVRLRGDDAVAFLDRLLPLDMLKLEKNRVGYSFLCDERGGIIDDVTVYKADDYILLVANGVNRVPVLDWLRGHVEGKMDVEIEDVTDSMCMIAIQGPMSESLFQTMTLGDLKSIKYYHFGILQASGARILVSRTGYTGEDGFEIYCGLMYLKPIWEKFIALGKAANCGPAGLGARDILRLEAAMPLYGHELTLDTTPSMAGLDKFVDYNKREFIGRTSMMHSTNSEFSQRLICFTMLDGSIPRAEAPISYEGMTIGRVTSGGFSPSLKVGIGMGYVDAIKGEPGTILDIEIHNKPHKAKVIKRPFYRRPKA